MSGFDAEWLRTREPFDAQSRDKDLAERFAAALAPTRGRAKRIVDLAAGTGSNFRALAPALGGDQEWLLIDHDPALIAAQREEIAGWSKRNGWDCEELAGGTSIRAGAAEWIVRARTLDLAHGLEEIDLAACDGVTTSAFLDLVSAPWLDRLCDAIARSRRPLLAVLTVDGRRTWHPALEADAHIERAFTRHQSGDKGFGAAHGPRATVHLAEGLARRGYEVATARSDWRINAEHRDMLLRMVEESAAVATESEPADAALSAAWLAQRCAQIASGLLSLEIGHLDLLAIPFSASLN